MNKIILSLLFFIIFSAIHAQDMNEGFTYLENGSYDKAKQFFKKILKEYPENRTAKLCYGRAVGLAGNASEATRIFTELREKYPDDFEIKLNYAESLLWNKNFDEAETFYVKLVTEHPESFAATLGYANTLSNLKKYVSALDMVNKALQIDKNNQNALISRKYIRLGYAFILSQNQEYEEALTLLDQNLVDFPEDKDTLLNKANLYLIINQYDKAEQAYVSVAKNVRDSIIALNGLSLVAHKKHQEKKALAIATQSLNKARNLKTTDEDVLISAQERYLQALLWNRKFSKAKTEIHKFETTHTKSSKVQSLRASLGMYTSDFALSLNQYNQILETDKKSFDGNLGIANAYRAYGLDMKAYEYAFKTLSYYPKQPDAEKLIAALKIAHTPFIENKTAFTFDNGDNEALNTSFKSEIPLSAKLRLTSNYSFRSAENSRTNVTAESHEASVGFKYQFTGRLGITTNIGFNTSNAITADYTALIGEAMINIKPFKLQNLDIGYKRELQNFNADLIDREIIMNNYFLNYNLGTNVNLGWYTQAMYTSQSDDNTRSLLFTSLYYTLLHRPVLKIGVNYQYISFQDQVPTIYFSPSSFNLVEFFAELLNDQQNDWFYSLSAAVGQQYVEDDPASTTFRTEGKIGHNFSKRFSANLYGKYSNIASATAAGFEFTEIGFRLKWYFLKKPIFNKKIMELNKDSGTQK